MAFDFQKDFTFLHAFISFVVGTLLVMCAHLLLRKRQSLAKKASTAIFIPRGYTVDELSEYDGVGKPWAFVGVKGIIYNCALEWYGANAPYHVFAGRDSSRHLGKMKLGCEEANADWTTLSDAHLSTLNEWEERLRSKYAAVGWIIPPPDFISKAEKFDR